MRLELVTAPVTAPVTVAEARALLGFSSSAVSDDALNTLLTAGAARLDGADGYLGRALITQTWDIVYDNWTGYLSPEPRIAHGDIVGGTRNYPGGLRSIQVPLPPLQSVTKITYLDFAGDEVTVPASDYQVSPGDPGRIDFLNGSAPQVELRIRCVVGYGSTPDKVPALIRTAVAMHAAAIRSSMTADPNIRSETTFGVDAVTYGGPGSAAAKTLEANQMVANFRVGGGIS